MFRKFQISLYNYPVFKFEILSESQKSRARVGRLTTDHGIIETPSFFPVGTQGAVKAVLPDQIKVAGATSLLANTYHLFLRPGPEIIAKFGGLHKFMSWDFPILTDSGGFQVFSLTKIRKITAEGVTFQSHVDGSWRTLTPAKVVELQEAFGADMYMPLDICPPYPATHEQLLNSVQQTTEWFKVSKKCDRERKNKSGTLFGIVQGGTDKELRKKSCQEIAALDPAGYGIGGLSVGEPRELLFETLPVITENLPKNQPKHLLGVGFAEDIEQAVQHGIDLFDTVLPTRLARHGSFLTDNRFESLRQNSYRDDDRPIDAHCDCVACQKYSRAYLRHLFITQEISVFTLLTIHNLRTLFRKLEEIRQRIREGKF